MPQLKAVLSLEEILLNRVGLYLIDRALVMKQDIIGNNKYFTETIHASLRTDILAKTRQILNERALCAGCGHCTGSELPARTLRKSNFSVWIGILFAMMDQSVHHLPHLYIYENMEQELLELINFFKHNRTKIHNLSIEFVILTQKDKLLLCKSLPTIGILLKTNVAFQLSKLVLPGVCTTKILEVIGANALCLKYFDVAGSSSVHNLGIGHLLFKNFDFHKMLNDMLRNSSVSDYDKLFNSVDKDLLNPCCNTLQVLRFTMNKATFSSALVSLSCVSTLKSFESYKCFSNVGVGDALIDLLNRFSEPRILELTDMHDCNLTEEKLIKFGECVPFVNKLITSYAGLITPRENLIFYNRIKTLIIERNSDPRFPRVIQFLSVYGYNIVHLKIDDNYLMDVAELVNSCPNLETLEGKLQADSIHVGIFAALKSLTLFVPNQSTANWMFESCPRLEQLSIFTDNTTEYLTNFIVKPPLVFCNNLTDLCIIFSFDVLLTHETVVLFIKACPNLRNLGHLKSWNSFYNITRQIKSFVRKKNYDLCIR